MDGLVPGRLAWLCLVGLAAWGVLSLFWSADWRNGLDGLIHGLALLSIAAAVSVLPPRALEWLPHAAGVSILAVAAFWSVEFAGFGNRNFATEYAMMALPFAWRAPKWIRGASLAALALVLVMNQGALKWVALLILLGLVLRPVRWGHWGVALSGALGVCYIAWALNPRLPESLLARLEFAINGLSLVAQAPLFGHGLGSLNAVYPGVAENHVRWLGPTTILQGAHRYVGALHNEALQWTVETGLVGAVLLGSLCAQLAIRYRHAIRADGLDRAGAHALAIGGVLACVGFPFQNPATGFIAAISIGLLVGRAYATRIVFGCAAAVFAAVAVLSTWASVEFARAVRLPAEQALQANIRAWGAYPLWSEPRRQMALIASAWARTGSPHPELVDRAFEVSRTASGDDPGLLVARIEYLLNSNRFGVREPLDRLMAKHSLQPQTKALRALLWSDEWLIATNRSTRPDRPSR